LDETLLVSELAAVFSSVALFYPTVKPFYIFSHLPYREGCCVPRRVS